MPATLGLAPLRIHVRSAEIRLSRSKLRMPFRFGIATLTDTPKLTMRVVVEDAEGRRAAGFSCDVLPALWFDKAGAKSIDEKVEDQIAMAERAAAFYLERAGGAGGDVGSGGGASTVFDLWLAGYKDARAFAEVRGINALTAGFGSSFAERATIDAACRLAGVSFFEALKGGSGGGLFGIDLGAVHPELAGFDLAGALPEAPLRRIACRHTVGLGDPLRAADIAPADRLNDGLPQALEEDIAEYGLHCFKIKIDGDRERNLARLSEMAAIFARMCPPGYRVTLDGNEQVTELSDVAWLLERLRATAEGRALVDGILFVEQPLPRDRALSDDVAPAVRELSRVRPLLLDESDDDPRALVRGREIGYGGISCKNCKGVFKAVLNKALIEHWRANGEDAPDAPGGPAPTILSSEDLTNTGVVPLQEDFATIAALGIDHSERNGHHYFRGLDHLTERERESALSAHPDIYERRADGPTTMRVREGWIEVGSIQAPGFGYSSEVEFESRG